MPGFDIGPSHRWPHACGNFSSIIGVQLLRAQTLVANRVSLASGALEYGAVSNPQ